MIEYDRYFVVSRAFDDLAARAASHRKIKQQHKNSKLVPLSMKSLITMLVAAAVASSFALAQDKPATTDTKTATGDGGKSGATTEKKPAVTEAKPAGEKRDPEAMFKKRDTNSDGAISLEEFKAGPRAQRDPAKAEENFKKMDKDNNGSLSLDEFKAGRPPRPPGGPGGRGPGGGGPGGKPPGGAPQ